jgi:hypothetical protein
LRFSGVSCLAGRRRFMIHVNASAECIDIFHFKFHTDFGCAFQEFPAWQDDGGHLLIIASAECHFKFHTDLIFSILNFIRTLVALFRSFLPGRTTADIYSLSLRRNALIFSILNFIRSLIRFSGVSCPAGRRRTFTHYRFGGMR